MLPVFPCNANKEPLIKGWQTLATTDPDQIARWQALFHDRLVHWGVPTGALTDLLVIDCDAKHDGYRKLTERYGALPATAWQRTKSGGFHFLYRYPKDGKHYGNRAGLFKLDPKEETGIDVRAEGGYICYYGVDFATPIVDAPEQFLAQLNAKTPHTQHEGPPVRVSPEIANSILSEAVASIRDASQGERNDTLNRKAFEIGQLVAGGTLPRENAERILVDAGLACGLPAYSVRATVSSGLDGGSKKPITTPFGATAPVILGLPSAPIVTRWTPMRFSAEDLMNTSALKKPQLFEDWSTEDICLTSADGGTGKTTLALCESVCLALGERFLGFNCLQTGRTLYITGEDTQQKIGGIIGAICRQMQLNNTQIATVMDGIYVKKDSDLCLVTKDRSTGFLHMNADAMRRVLEAVEDIKPKRIVFDPISMFWGPESALNDMNKVVAKFMSELSERSGAQVEMINHMGKASSSSKDFTQFAGRGGSGLPSHSRVVRSMHVVHGEEYTDLTGENLTERQSAIRIVISKFSDGSPLYNKPFVLVRDGYLFHRKTLAPQKERELEDSQSDTERVMTFIKEARTKGKFPTKAVIEGHFLGLTNKLTQVRTTRAIDKLMFDGWNGEKIKMVENPDAMSRSKVFVVTDEQGNEVI